MARKTRSGVHFGSRIVLASDGTVFVTTGDRGDADRAQDMRAIESSIDEVELGRWSNREDSR